jgi:long-subunit acyl-CoA synthetase (AMP-forming)
VDISLGEKGRFIIIDRRKNVLKLAQGEYISPERLEGVVLAELGYIAQATSPVRNQPSSVTALLVSSSFL